MEQGCGLEHDHDAALNTDVHVSGHGSMENTGMPDYEQGDIVQWQVNPKMMGRVVHVDQERDVLMVEVFERSDTGTMQPSGFTITAGFTDVTTVEKGIPTDADTLQVSVTDETTSITTQKQQAAEQSAENDAPSGIYVDDDGNWFGISPEEGGGEPKYDLNNCNDVGDAWNLRNNGDFSVEVSTLEARIKRAADAHGCDEGSLPNTMTNDEDDTENMTEIELDTGDLSLDKVAEMNDEVAQVIEERNRFKQDHETVQEVRDTLEIDSDVCPCDVVDDLLEDYAELEQDLQSYQEREREEVIERIEKHTDRYEEAYEDMSLDELKDTAETVEELAADVKGAESGGSASSSTSTGGSSGGGSSTQSYNRVWIGERRNDLKGDD